jgi:hypothetical protein
LDIQNIAAKAIVEFSTDDEYSSRSVSSGTYSILVWSARLLLTRGGNAPGVFAPFIIRRTAIEVLDDA